MWTCVLMCDPWVLESVPTGPDDHGLWMRWRRGLLAAFSGGKLGMIKGSLPDFTESFKAFAANLKARAEKKGA